MGVSRPVVGFLSSKFVAVSRIPEIISPATSATSHSITTGSVLEVRSSILLRLALNPADCVFFLLVVVILDAPLGWNLWWKVLEGRILSSLG